MTQIGCPLLEQHLAAKQFHSMRPPVWLSMQCRAMAVLEALHRFPGGHPHPLASLRACRAVFLLGAVDETARRQKVGVSNRPLTRGIYGVGPLQERSVGW